MTAQNGWRWCHKCQGMFFAGNPSQGICPKDGQPHDGSQSAGYVATFGDDALGRQRGWRWCHKCQGMFFAGNPSQGICPKDGQPHDGSQSAGYAAAFGDDAPGQQGGWRWCYKCQGMFFARNPSQGTCPLDSQPHDGTASNAYAIRWDLAELNSIIDLSHHNQNLDFRQIQTQGGILGVIHKATQGLRFQDPNYVTNKGSALSAGLLWGAYHFGTGSDGVQQAEFFLDCVNPDDQTLLVLDFEANPQGPSMTLEEARAFVTHVQTATGHWPGFYSGHYIKELLGANQDPILSNCWFWLAQYGPTAIVPANWETWTMWQYTDGAQGPAPHDVPGAGRCDRDKFAGDETNLRELWGAP